ncbi:fibroblast growth factor-binding protein 2 [Xyrichtys novacula]|uniref:Fibroblast growth factor-binding protein 2 n=1 Tax=Xyrichtys novacula TaxID=13765 RepID=A0AAV1FEH3_XYRNO|nr:fibroblast growth factor-binding protein 2 [Xyrichtys novacula]
MCAKAGLLLLLLLACCVWSAESQGEGRRQSIWDEPIKFSTKNKDLCTMVVTGHGEYTRLRLSCQSNKRSYWCEYLGKPYTCRSYSKNPRHYFVQMMWGLRKLQNACMGPKQIKPHMCRKAADESQMVFSSASFSRQWPEISTRARPAAAKPQPQPQPQPRSQPQPQPQPRSPPQPQPRPAPTRSDPSRHASIPRFSTRFPTQRRPGAQPTDPSVESNAKRIARQYCWRSLHGVCSYVIGLFRN